jgi:hypothetical protein
VAGGSLLLSGQTQVGEPNIGSMCSDTLLPQSQLRRRGNNIAVISTLCVSAAYRLFISLSLSLSLVSLCRRDKFVA